MGSLLEYRRWKLVLPLAERAQFLKGNASDLGQGVGPEKYGAINKT
jgi:hypothetical protein